MFFFTLLFFLYFTFLCKMDMDSIEKLNDRTLFIHKNLFGLFSRKSETSLSREINCDGLEPANQKRFVLSDGNCFNIGV